MVVASLVVRVLGEVDDAIRGLNKVDAKVNETAKKMKAIGTAMVAIGAVGAAGLFGVINAAANFEQAMANVAAVTDLTGDQFEDVSNLARQLGRDTVFSATEAAGAIEELAKAGVGTEDILNGAARGALNLAAAAGTTTDVAATIVSNAMNIFQLAGDQATHIADVLAAGANKSAASVESLGLGMAQSANVAAMFGLDLEDTVGALALFADYGLKGSDAGTSFKTALTSMLTPVGTGAKTIEELGLNFRDANGEFIGLAGAADELHRVLDPLPQAQRDAALASIFGSDAIRVGNILYGAGSEKIREYTEAVNDEGAAQRMAEERTKTMRGALERMQGAIADLSISIGEVLTPYVAKLAGWVETAAEKFSALPRPFKVAAALALVLVAALLPLGTALIAVAAVLPVIAAVLPVIAAGLALLTGPVGGVIVALAILGVAYKKNILGFGDAVDGMVKALRPVGRWIRLFVEGLRKLGKDTQRTHKILNALPKPLSKILLIFARVKQGVDRFIKAWKEAGALAAFRTIPRSIEMLGRTIGNFFQSIGLNRFGQQFKQVFKEIGDVIGSLVDLVSAVIRGDWAAAWDALVDLARNAVELFVAHTKAQFALILDFLSHLPFGERAIEIGTSIIDGIVEGLESRLDGLLGWIEGAVGILVGVFKTLLGIASPSTVFREIGIDIMEGLRLGLIAGFRAVAGWFAGLAGRILGAITGAIGWLVGVGEDVLTGLWNGILAVWEGVRGWFGDIGTAILSAVPDEATLVETLYTAGKRVLEGLENGIEAVWKRVSGWLGTLAVNVLAALPSIGVLLGTLTNAGKAIAEGLWAGVQAGWKSVKDFFSGIGDTIAGILNAVNWSVVKTAFSPLTGLLDSIVSSINTIGNWIGGGGGSSGTDTGGQASTGGESTAQAMTVSFDPGSSLTDIETWATGVEDALSPLAAYVIFATGSGGGATTSIAIQAPPFKGDGSLNAIKRWVKDATAEFKRLNLASTEQMRALKANVDIQLAQTKTIATTRTSQIRAAMTNEFVGARSDATTVFTGMRNSIANALTGARNDAVQLATSLRTGVVNQFDSMRSRAGGAGEGATNVLKTSVRNAFNTMRDEAIARAESLRHGVVNQFVGMRNEAASVASGLASRVAGAIYNARDAANAAASSFYFVGQNIAVGIRNGISDTAYIIANAAAAAVNGAINAANQAAGNASPSKRGIWTGSMIAQGMALGIERGMRDVARAGGRLAGAAFGSSSGLWTVGGSGVAPVAAVAGGSRGGDSYQFNIDVTVQGGGDVDGLGTAIARAVLRESNVKGKPKGFR